MGLVSCDPLAIFYRLFSSDNRKRNFAGHGCGQTHRHLKSARRHPESKIAIYPEKTNNEVVASYSIGVLAVVCIGVVANFFILKKLLLIFAYSNGIPSERIWPFGIYTTPSFIKTQIAPYLILFDATIGLALVALSEELVSRRIFSNLMSRVTESKNTIVLTSSFVFAAYHFSNGYASMLIVFCFGIIFMNVYIQTRSLWVVAIPHYFYNLIFYYGYPRHDLISFEPHSPKTKPLAKKQGVRLECPT